MYGTPAPVLPNPMLEPGPRLRTFTSESFRFLSEEELAEKKRAAEDARGRRYREIDERLDMSVIAYENDSLGLRWASNSGGRAPAPGAAAWGRAPASNVLLVRV